MREIEWVLYFSLGAELPTTDTFTSSEGAKILAVEPQLLQSWDKRACLPVEGRLPGTWRRFSVQELAVVSLQCRLVDLGLPVSLACRFARQLESAVLAWGDLKSHAVVAWFEINGSKAYSAVALDDLSKAFDRSTWRDATLYDSGSEQGRALRPHDVATRKPSGVIAVDLQACVDRVISGVRRLLGDPIASVLVVEKK